MKPILELIRLEETEQGTFGVLKVNKELFCWTLEPPDNENAPNISSIPAQQYLCEHFYRQSKGYNTYRVLNVPERTAILFHPGTDYKDTEGCIILGYEKVGYELYKSTVAFKDFMKKLNHTKIVHLTIKEEY